MLLGGVVNAVTAAAFGALVVPNYRQPGALRYDWLDTTCMGMPI